MQHKPLQQMQNIGLSTVMPTRGRTILMLALNKGQAEKVKQMKLTL